MNDTALDQKDIFNHLLVGGTVLTATRRLSRELLSRYDQHQLETGRNAWPSADILPWDAWLQRTWEEIQPDLLQPLLLLGESQVTALWQRVIEQDIQQQDSGSLPLWNNYSTAREANKAWRLVQDWQLNFNDIRSSAHPDHRAFVRWCGTFAQICGENHWVDSACLPGLLRNQISKPISTAVLLCGFDRVTPQMQSLVDSLTEHGSTITMVQPKITDYQQTSCGAFSDEYGQWLAAGQWARQQIDNNPLQRIAIVAPDLEGSRSIIDYALRQALYPADLLNPADSAQLPFHLSLGRPLIEYDVVRAAFDLIESLSSNHLPPAQVRALLLSPYIGGYASEFSKRGLLLRQLERRLNFHTALVDLEARVTANGSCPLLQQVLSGLAGKLQTAPVRDSLRRWSDWFGALLVSAGWPGDGERGSDIFQVVNAFRSQIESLGEIDLVSPPVDLNAALSLFRNRLGSQIFQSEAHDAPVQVMGIQESAGLEFDAVWFGGLIEEQWPVRAAPNPFIPVPMQRAADIPQATTAGNATLCQQQMLRLAGSTGELRLSCYRYDGEVEVVPSPLIVDCAITNVSNDNSGDLAHRISKARPENFTLLTDNRGPNLQTTDKVTGGTSLIRAQSRCPRQAFLQYRLHGDESQAHQQGLDPSQRGSLIHRLLELTWREIKDSHALASWTDSALQQKIAAHVETEAGRYYYVSGCGRRFFKVQQEWLVTTLMAWFEVERQRAMPFTVLGMEEKASLSLSGLELEFKIDRIDRFEDQSLGLIDYKTGSTTSIGDWANQRPGEPQLPLYWMTRQEQVSMVAYAKVRLGNCRLTGVTANPQLAENTKSIQLFEPAEQRQLKNYFADWQQLGDHWQTSMQNLAAEFVEGDARINPRKGGLCPQCPTPAFCRTGDHPVDDFTFGDDEPTDEPQ